MNFGEFYKTGVVHVVEPKRDHGWTLSLNRLGHQSVTNHLFRVWYVSYYEFKQIYLIKERP